MKRRKHRVVLEVTFEQPVTGKDAAWLVDQLIAVSPALKHPVQFNRYFGNTFTVVRRAMDFRRVLSGLRKVRHASV